MFALRSSLTKCLVLSMALSACSSGTNDRGEGDNAEGGKHNSGPSLLPSNEAGSGTGESSTTNASAYFEKTSDGGCKLQMREEACVGAAFESESVPLDIFIMLDRSGSMCKCVDPVFGEGTNEPCPNPNCKTTRIDAIRQAVGAFLKDPGSLGIGVGIGYFGQQELRKADCRPETYSQPSVGIGVVPDNEGALLESLSFATPIGETPTGGAIRGACDYARRWKRDHSGHQTVVLFVTDGEPKAPLTCPLGDSAVAGLCCPTLEDAVQAASDCNSGDTAIHTYVLGVGPFLSNLTQIAAAGGTEKAYLVEGGDVASEVLSALNQIRGNASIPCQFKLPTADHGKVPNYAQVGIAYADFRCQAEVFVQVQSAKDCGDKGGFYFDNPDAPEEVQLCPSKCSAVAAAGGKLFYSVGCGWDTTALQ